MHGRFSDPYFKVLWEEVKLNFWVFSYGHPQQKVLKGQEISGMGCPKIFREKGKKSQGGGRKAPHPHTF